jgi:hypothetical protein
MKFSKIVKPGTMHKARVLPKHIRNNPFAEIPPLNEKELSSGIYNLVNNG